MNKYLKGLQLILLLLFVFFVLFFIPSLGNGYLFISI
uniref:Uncharacterized protein n=1 Tax=Rhizophora mucronata TaxID=61149 RepID=A0A2P2QI88_RHIMU